MKKTSNAEAQTAAEPEQKVFFNIEKVDGVWKVRGQLNNGNMKDALDFIMILLTNAVRIALSISDIDRTHKHMKKALTSQLHDIIVNELKEARDAKRTKLEDEAISNSDGEAARQS